MSLNLCPNDLPSEAGTCSQTEVGCGANEYITQITISAPDPLYKGYITNFRSIICRNNITGQSRNVTFTDPNVSSEGQVVPVVSNNCPNGFESIEWITQGDNFPMGLKTFRLKCRGNFGYDTYMPQSYDKTPPEKINTYKAPEGKVISKINVASYNVTDVPVADRLYLTNSAPVGIRTLGFNDTDTTKNFNEQSVFVDTTTFQLNPICPVNNTNCRTFEFDCPNNYFMATGKLQTTTNSITSLSELTCMPRDSHELLNVPYPQQGIKSNEKQITTCNNGYQEVQYSTSLINSGLDSVVNGVRFRCSGSEIYGPWFGSAPTSKNVVGSIICPEHQSLIRLMGTYDINGNWSSIQSTSLDCADNSRTSYKLNNSGASSEPLESPEHGYAWLFAMIFVIITMTMLFVFSYVF